MHFNRLRSGTSFFTSLYCFSRQVNKVNKQTNKKNTGCHVNEKVLQPGDFPVVENLHVLQSAVGTMARAVVTENKSTPAVMYV